MTHPTRPIRLVALDVDGTLLDPREAIRPRVREAIRTAMEAGCLVTLATGRRFVGAQAIAVELGLPLPLILHGGAVIQDSASGAVIYQDPHEPETVEAVVRLLVGQGRQPIVYQSPALGGGLYSGPPERDSPGVRAYERARGPLVRVSDHELAAVRQALGIATFDERPDELRRLARHVAEIPGTATLVSFWTLVSYEALEVFRAGCSKATALAHLAAAHGVGMDEVMAIGDGLNDCEILAAVGLGVAMGNACPEARAAARVQVGTNEQDGVAEAIERFVLGRDSA